MTDKVTIAHTDWGASLLVNPGADLADKNLHQVVKELLTHLRKVGKMKIIMEENRPSDIKSITHLYQEARNFMLAGGSGFKVAMVAPAKVDKENSKFYVNACFNRGFEVKYFSLRNEAMLWLLG